ncbi:Ltp family lipoprotein [Halobacillus sp. SY10]|uniref:Ltp family lipoprotein n=1 Tax=Halobacillus sp. SY10 TaxID=3381356 RepID=UPI003879828B
MDAFLLILMSLALAGTIVFSVFAFVKGKDHRRRNFLKSGGCLYACFVLAMFVGSEDGALLTFLVILMVTALAGMVVFFILAFVKGKGNRLGNFLKSGGCLLALLAFVLIAGAMSEDVPVTEEVNASITDKEAEAKAKQEEEDKEREAKEQEEKERDEQEAKEQAQKELEEQEAKEQAQKELEEREAKEQAQKEQEEREAREKAQKDQEAKEAEEQKKKEEEERKAKEEAEQKAKEEEERKAKEDSVTVSQKQAVAMAEHYLSFMAFSKSGLIDQLEFEGFSTEDATYGVEHISVDWQEQAVIKAEEYLDFMAFSRQGLIDQLVFEGFSQEHAAYAASQVGL